MTRHGQYRDPELQRDKNRAYQRGYANCLKGSWPEHKPPFPPDEIVRAMFEAARKLRDAADNAIALDGPPEESVLEKELGPGIDAIDAASEALTEWLKRSEGDG